MNFFFSFFFWVPLVCVSPRLRLPTIATCDWFSCLSGKPKWKVVSTNVLRGQRHGQKLQEVDWKSRTWTILKNNERKSQPHLNWDFILLFFYGCNLIHYFFQGPISMFFFFLIKHKCDLLNWSNTNVMILCNMNVSFVMILLFFSIPFFFYIS